MHRFTAVSFKNKTKVVSISMKKTLHESHLKCLPFTATSLPKFLEDKRNITPFYLNCIWSCRKKRMIEKKKKVKCKNTLVHIHKDIT